MKKYLLDSNIIIEISNNNQKIASSIEKFALEGGLTTTLFNFIEVYFGAYNKKHQEKSLQYLGELEELPLTKKSSILFVHLKHKYLKKGHIMGDFDLLIAVIAIENDLILLTTDNDFKQIEELNKIILEI